MGKLRELLTGAVRIATDLDPEREVGLALPMSHLLGTAIARHITAVDPVAGMTFDQLVDRTALAVQAHLQ